MSNAVWFISYELVEGASVPEFLLAAEGCCKEVASKKKGYISWKQLKQGNTWVDLMTFETMEDAINFEEQADPDNPYASKFYSFINPDTLDSQMYSVEKSY